MLEPVGKQFGNYRILHLLGKGGFAQVYLGEHIYLNTMAAIKVLHANLPENDLQAFLSEAQMVAHLRHPHIVRVLEFGVTPEHVPFLAMTYAPHGTLRQRHPKGTVVPLENIVAYITQVAAALQFAHAQKLVHRDVKPENMLIGHNDEVLLSDFGIAVAARNTLSQSREEIGGTVFYMAPEQLQGRPRPASDQYALGVIAYEWLCGTLPFTGSAFMEIAFHQMQSPPPPLYSRNPNISPAIEEVIMRALAKEPSARFEHIQAFAQALEAACYTSSPSIPLPLAPFIPPAYSDANPSAPDVAPLRDPAAATLKFTFSSGDDPVQSSPTLPGRFSRRVAVTTLAGVLGLGVLGGGFAWAELTHTSAVPQPAPRLVFSVLPSRPPGTTLAIYSQHTGPVTSLSWSPYGKWITSSSEDKTVHVWSPSKTGKGQSFIYSGHTDKVMAVAWSSDGKYIASGSNDKTVRVWNAPYTNSNNVGETLIVYQGSNSVIPALAWSPDSKRIASTTLTNMVQTWDANSGKHASYYQDAAQSAPQPAPGPANSVAWSPDGFYIASSVLYVSVWNISNENRLVTYSGQNFIIVHGLAWSPDSKRVASAGEDKTVQIWDATTGTTLITYKGHTDAVYAVSWSPDGKYLASASRDKTVQIWEASSGKHVVTYRGHTATVTTVAWYGDSRHVASGGADKKVLIWQGV